jgi:hypothetical protein
MAVFFLFIDGIGLGPQTEDNPFYTHEWSFFKTACAGQKMTIETHEIIDNRLLFKGIDANLDVDGLPQSGTGQVSLFTGVNASQKIGRHFGPYPHSGTHEILNEFSIVRRAASAARSFQFMNAYPPIFFRMSEQKNRWSTTTLMCRQGGIRLNGVDDVNNGTAITAEITQEVWREKLRLNIPIITPVEAAQRMVKASEKADVLLYEYYLTDKVGHAQDHELANQVLHRLDLFLTTLVDNLKETDLLVLSSDHGNLEDLGTKSHTRNPVPLIAIGNKADAFADAKSIIDIVPILEKVW